MAPIAAKRRKLPAMLSFATQGEWTGICAIHQKRHSVRPSRKRRPPAGRSSFPRKTGALPPRHAAGEDHLVPTRGCPCRKTARQKLDLEQLDRQLAIDQLLFRRIVGRLLGPMTLPRRVFIALWIAAAAVLGCSAGGAACILTSKCWILLIASNNRAVEGAWALSEAFLQRPRTRDYRPRPGRRADKGAARRAIALELRKQTKLVTSVCLANTTAAEVQARPQEYRGYLTG